MSVLIGSLTIGLILALLALGVFITFKIFHFPDLTTEGSITFGAAITATLIVKGYDPILAVGIAFLGGCLAGIVTGILHTVFKLNGLLSGILVMTALYSINLHVMGRSNIPLLSETTLITQFESLANPDQTINVLGWMIPEADLIVLGCILLITLLIGLFLNAFFKTDLGMAMRAAGNNDQMIRALGANTKVYMILGIALSNGLIAVSGGLLAQYQGFADVQMGIGMVVWGLASVIIGEALIHTKSVGFLIFGAIMGSVIFRQLVAIALQWGMDPNDLKLITALFVFVALILPGLLNKLENRRKIKKLNHVED
jgi:putative ABC transport system permease protein